MRLLDAETFEFHEFDPSSVPGYAILSHTWDRDEVTYEDVAIRFGEQVQHKAGWKKIKYTCKEALEDQLRYVWVDTCCIDKRSSAELSEAINSMFAWYQQATVCYVYLADIRLPLSADNALAQARWFTRGWTLQELLAPSALEFFSVDWINIGRIQKAGDDLVASKSILRAESTNRDRGDIGAEVAAITGIELEVLNGQKLLEAVCVARRMSWASSRQTTRPEDIAYCLLGLFNINLPTIYGEGTKAFQRLQEEIVKSVDDHSLFAWTAPDAPPSEPYGLLAASPAYFANSKDVSAFRDWTDTSAYSVGNLGLAITLPVWTTPTGEPRAFLNCTWFSPVHHRVCLVLRRIPGTTNQYQRVRVAEREKVQNFRSLELYSRTQIYLRQKQILPSASDVIEKRLCHISLAELGIHGHSTRLLSSFLHTDIAVGSKDWYQLLLQQEVSANSTDLQTTFYLAGERATLSIVFCLETIPERDDEKIGRPVLKRQSYRLRDIKEQRRRQCQSSSRWKKLRKNLKPSSRQDSSLEDLSSAQSHGSKHLVLVGTSHDSHYPICIPYRAPSYNDAFEQILERQGEVPADGAEQDWDHIRRKNRCRLLFKELADAFQSMARAHWVHPDCNIRSGTDLLSMALVYGEPAGDGPLSYRLEMHEAQRYELDSTELAAETETRALEAARIETTGALPAATAIPPLNSAADGNEGDWVQWHGEPEEPVLHNNVFELGESRPEDSEDEFHESEETAAQTPVDLTTIGGSRRNSWAA